MADVTVCVGAAPEPESVGAQRAQHHQAAVPTPTPIPRSPHRRSCAAGRPRSSQSACPAAVIGRAQPGRGAGGGPGTGTVGGVLQGRGGSEAATGGFIGGDGPPLERGGESEAEQGRFGREYRGPPLPAIPRAVDAGSYGRPPLGGGNKGDGVYRLHGVQLRLPRATAVGGVQEQTLGVRAGPGGGCGPPLIHGGEGEGAQDGARGGDGRGGGSVGERTRNDGAG